MLPSRPETVDEAGPNITQQPIQNSGCGISDNLLLRIAYLVDEDNCLSLVSHDNSCTDISMDPSTEQAKHTSPTTKSHTMITWIENSDVEGADNSRIRTKRQRGSLRRARGLDSAFRAARHPSRKAAGCLKMLTCLIAGFLCAMYDRSKTWTKLG